MKRITVLIIIYIAVLQSCSKKNWVVNVNPSSGSIQYKVNGQLMTMDNANASNGENVVFAKQLKGSVLPATRYLMNAERGSNNVLLLSIASDSLHEINYYYDSTYQSTHPSELVFDISFNGEIGTLSFGGDNFDINISSYKNRKISGTFSGKLSSTPDYNKRGNLIITEGVFNNIPVIY
jgi:hypothetical protein